MPPVIDQQPIHVSPYLPADRHHSIGFIKIFHDNVCEVQDLRCGRIVRAAHSPVREVLLRYAFNKVKVERGVLAERLDVLFAHLFPPLVGGVHVSVLADN